MTVNRRNYYRVLHIQPESPPELIRASYRTLMGPLRMHPDLGGDPRMAQLINEAYAELSDPARRAAYDLRHSPAALRKPPSAAAEAAAGAASAATAGRRPADAGADPDRWIRLRRCPLCDASWPARVTRETRCVTCASPLAAAPDTSGNRPELFGRRASTRRARQQWATLQAGWPAAPLQVRWRDLSLTGLSIESSRELAPGLSIRITDPTLDAVARVVTSRRIAAGCSIHARLLTAVFLRPSGVFVSQVA